jgi:hypothetical protein
MLHGITEKSADAVRFPTSFPRVLGLNLDSNIGCTILNVSLFSAVQPEKM